MNPEAEHQRSEERSPQRMQSTQEVPWLHNYEGAARSGRSLRAPNETLESKDEGIYLGERNGIYIIDLQKTLKMFKGREQVVQEMATQGKIVLFVGTKRQAQDAIAEEATRCGMFYINQRWLGGLLTNWVTVQKSVKRLERGLRRHGHRWPLRAASKKE